jgi:hypothetical protein
MVSSRPNPVADHVRDMMAKVTTWTGSASDLHRISWLHGDRDHPPYPLGTGRRIGNRASRSRSFASSLTTYFLTAISFHESPPSLPCCDQSRSDGSRGQAENSWGYAGQPMDTAEIRCQLSMHIRRFQLGRFFTIPSALPPTLVPLTKTRAEHECEIKFQRNGLYQ